MYACMMVNSIGVFAGFIFSDDISKLKQKSKSFVSFRRYGSIFRVSDKHMSSRYLSDGWYM